MCLDFTILHKRVEEKHKAEVCTIWHIKSLNLIEKLEMMMVMEMQEPLEMEQKAEIERTRLIEKPRGDIKNVEVWQRWSIGMHLE